MAGEMDVVEQQQQPLEEVLNPPPLNSRTQTAKEESDQEHHSEKDNENSNKNKNKNKMGENDYGPSASSKSSRRGYATDQRFTKTRHRDDGYNDRKQDDQVPYDAAQNYYHYYEDSNANYNYQLQQQQHHHHHHHHHHPRQPYEQYQEQVPLSKRRTLTDAVENGIYLPPAKRRALTKQKQQQNQDETKKSKKKTENDSDDDDEVGVAKDAEATTTTLATTTQIQRETWDEQRRVVFGTLNRLNSATIKPLIHDLFAKVNLIRMRGVLVKSLLQAVTTSGTSTTSSKGSVGAPYSAVYAALVAVLNTKLPELGALVVTRCILAWRTHYQHRQKTAVVALSVFLGHLFHQAVVHELLLLQILTLLLEGAQPTNDGVEVAVQLLRTTGRLLLEVTPAGVRAVLERLRSLLHQGGLHPRVEQQVQHVLELRKTGFRKPKQPKSRDSRQQADDGDDDDDDDAPIIPVDLDLVEQDDQITHEISLDDEDLQNEEHLNTFHVNPNYAQDEAEWNQIRAEILGLNPDDDESDDGESETDDDGDDDDEEEEDEPDEKGAAETSQALVPADNNNKKMVVVQDLTEAELVHLRRTIYLTIMSSATFEECTHKLAKITIPEGREEELINMVIECCSQERTFLRYYGMIAARFCLLHDRWRDAFMRAFAQQYNTIHRLETNKLRNVAKLFAHLLYTDSLPWTVLSVIHLNEDETTSSSRIFVKIIVQEMAGSMGMAKLKERLKVDEKTMTQQALSTIAKNTEANKHEEGQQQPQQEEDTGETVPTWARDMFPTDNIRHTRYAINFFTSIGLGPLTDGLRAFLKLAPKLILAQKQQQQQQLSLQKEKKQDEDDDDASSVLSSSSSSSSSSVSSSSRSSRSYSSSSSYSSRSSSRSNDRRRRSRGRSDSGRGRGAGGRRRRSRSVSSSSSSSRASRSSRDDDRKKVGRKGQDDERKSRGERARSRSPPRRQRESESPPPSSSKRVSRDSDDRRRRSSRDHSRSVSPSPKRERSRR